METKKRLVMILVITICSFLAGNVLAVQINEVEANAPVIRGEYTGNTGLGTGVLGYASDSATSNTTVGTAGISNSTGGIGVMGWALGASGTTYGVFGFSNSPDGYGVYSAGNMKVAGDLKVTGALPEYTNLALSATVTASSEFNSGYAADNVIDGLVNRWNQGEWASAGEKEGAWVQLDWVSAQDINEVKIYDRPNKYDQILDAWVQILHQDSSISEVHLGMFPYGCAPKEVYLTQAEGSDVMALKVYVTDAASTTVNVGLSEIECYYNPNRW